MIDFSTKRVAMSVSVVILVSQLIACSTTGASSASAYEEPHRHRGQIYAGAGLGLSKLEPDTSARPGFEVSDSNSMSSQLTLGVDVSRQFSTEVHLANLGSAELAPQGDVDYQIGGVSGLLYAGKNRHNIKRRGLTGYGRVGAGVLQNSTTGGLAYEKVNGAHLLLGLGAEYNTRSGLGIRGEIISYEQDANVLQLALIYRFNKKRREYIEPLAQATSETAPLIAPIAAVAVMLDTDNDGVKDDMDQCPTTGANVSVDSNGCALFSGVIESVNFHSNSVDLTDSAKNVLDEAAITLKKFSSASVQVRAHTDSRGNDDYNMSLSSKRADSVTNYLVSRGITKTRLSASAYGETQPIANNKTAEGRAQNRRVELFATD